MPARYKQSSCVCQYVGLYRSHIVAAVRIVIYLFIDFLISAPKHIFGIREDKHLEFHVLIDTK